MTAVRRPHVLIAGGGIAALELLLALRVLAGPRVAVTLLTADAVLSPRAMTVAEPFERGGAQAYDWGQIAAQHDASVVLDRLIAVDSEQQMAFTHDGRRVPYDLLVLTVGARRIASFPAALTFGIADDAASQLRAAVADVLAHPAKSIAFTLASPAVWSLPLYELALLTAHELREHGSGAAVRIVTPELHVLELFGAAGRDAVLPLLEAVDIEVVTRAQPRAVDAAGLRFDHGDPIPADHVVTLADSVARQIAGLPVDGAGFVPVDLHGRVTGQTAIYAAGEVTSFPLRQGGIA
jgi:sulfide:quinone oxidoreductase